MKYYMDEIKNENNICYLVGDYNIDPINIEWHSLTSEFNDDMYSGVFIDNETHWSYSYISDPRR